MLKKLPTRMSQLNKAIFATLPFAFGVTLSWPIQAADNSTTEAQYQGGNLDTPSFAGGGDSWTNILTLQHASGWKYGDNFFFIDFLNDNNDDGFNNVDAHAEWYSNISLSKVTGRKIGLGPIKDIGIFPLAFNYTADVNSRKYLPGIRLSWDIPGFAFFNTDIEAFIDFSEGLSSGGAPSEDNTFQVDVNWAYPFAIGGHGFDIQGHIEYVGERTNELGQEVSWWILGQPQFRYDLGRDLWNTPDQVYVGMEFQFWINKLGDEDTDEVAPQALVVWRF